MIVKYEIILQAYFRNELLINRVKNSTIKIKEKERRLFI